MLRRLQKRMALLLIVNLTVSFARKKLKKILVTTPPQPQSHRKPKPQMWRWMSALILKLQCGYPMMVVAVTCCRMTHLFNLGFAFLMHFHCATSQQISYLTYQCYSMQLAKRSRTGAKILCDVPIKLCLAGNTLWQLGHCENSKYKSTNYVEIDW